MPSRNSDKQRASGRLGAMYSSPDTHVYYRHVYGLVFSGLISVSCRPSICLSRSKVFRSFAYRPRFLQWRRHNVITHRPVTVRPGAPDGRRSLSFGLRWRCVCVCVRISLADFSRLSRPEPYRSTSPVSNKRAYVGRASHFVCLDGPECVWSTVNRQQTTRIERWICVFIFVLI